MTDDIVRMTTEEILIENRAVLQMVKNMHKINNAEGNLICIWEHEKRNRMRHRERKKKEQQTPSTQTNKRKQNERNSMVL